MRRTVRQNASAIHGGKEERTVHLILADSSKSGYKRFPESFPNRDKSTIATCAYASFRLGGTGLFAVLNFDFDKTLWQPMQRQGAHENCKKERGPPIPPLTCPRCGRSLR